MSGKSLVAVLALVVPFAAQAQETGKYQCTYGDLTRRVEILTEPGMTVPCEVHYYKDTEAPGEKQVLWSAASQEGYCESKTDEFIARLEGWGWDCGRGAAPAAAPEPPAEPEPAAAPEAADEPEPVRDDTDVLSPGDPSS